MTTTQLGLLICLGILSCVFVAMLRVPLSRHALDVPKDRSSHTQATPRGGGCAIWIAYSIGLAMLMALDHIEMFTFIAFLGAGSLAMLSGLLDDIAKGGIKAETRLVFHAVAVVWAIAWLGGIEKIHIFGLVWQWGYAEQIFLVLAMIWVINNTTWTAHMPGDSLLRVRCNVACAVEPSRSGRPQRPLVAYTSDATRRRLRHLDCLFYRPGHADGTRSY